MAATGLAGGLASLVGLRLLTGMGSAGANISIMGLAPSWFSEKRRGMACGFLVGGSGLAMTVTGWLVPLLNGLYLQHGWRVAWVLLGFITIVIGLLSGLFIRNNPGEKGLEPFGGQEVSSPGKNREPVAKMNLKDILSFKGVPILAAIYFCFGFSYIIYATFFVNYLILERGYTQVTAGGIWSLVGFLSIGSAIIWGILSDIIGRRPSLVIIFMLQVLSYLTPVLTEDFIFIKISAVIYGLTAWSIPGIVASYCGDLVGPKNAPTTLGLVTFFFGIGSVLAPTFASYIKEVTFSFSGAFYLASLLAFTGALLSLKGSMNWLRLRL